ncbi:hypothetical protein AB0G15_05920 [Streptosporangium sp. NPDC023825]
MDGPDDLTDEELTYLLTDHGVDLLRFAYEDRIPVTEEFPGGGPYPPYII